MNGCWWLSTNLVKCPWRYGRMGRGRPVGRVAEGMDGQGRVKSILLGLADARTSLARAWGFSKWVALARLMVARRSGRTRTGVRDRGWRRRKSATL